MSKLLEEAITDLDHLVDLVKRKGDREGFSFEDMKVILCSELVRLELSESKELSDRSFGAFCSIGGWSYHYYRGIHDEIHNKILKINDALERFNENEYKADIGSPVGNNKDDWYRYFGGMIRNLLEKK